jgi:hypothetical protein
MFARFRNRDTTATLWEVSERETGITFDINPPPRHPAATPRPPL